MRRVLHIVGVFIMARYVRRWRSRPALERHQRRLLARQLRFFARRSRHLAPALAGSKGKAPAGALAALPLMDKAAMMAHFDDLVTVPITREAALEHALGQERSRDFDATLAGCSVGLSSGTSGHRGLFVVSPREREAWVGTVLALALPRGRTIRGHRIALFLRADNSLYEAVESQAVAFRFFDTFAPLEPQVGTLADFAPTVLVGPPSVLVEVARLAEAASVTIRPGRVISAAEVLDSSQRERLQRGFGVDVIHQLYQCTEGFLGHTCEHGVLHLNEQIALIEREYVGPRRFVPIVTDLRRRAQPIVRYRLNDVLVERDHPCECGSALLALDAIEGREGDALVGFTADGTSRVVFADLVARAMTYAEGFTDYRVVQTAPGALRVELDTPPGGAAFQTAQASVTAELAALFASQGCAAPRIEFAPYHHDLAHKLRRVTREDFQ